MSTNLNGTVLYSVPELSAKLNVTPVTIRKYLQRNWLRGNKVMGRWFIFEDDVVELFLDEKKGDVHQARNL